jgi:hypothetical protein
MTDDIDLVTDAENEAAQKAADAESTYKKLSRTRDGMWKRRHGGKSC